jgi:HPt (histidine-containing phosphotransfer) domain-containing protein
LPKDAQETPGTAVDFEHLERQTHGDAALEHEVLQLFDRQCERLGADIAGPDAGRRVEAAHALVGAARAIGAWDVADLARAVEEDDRAHAGDLVRDLLAALSEAQLAVRARAGRGEGEVSN